MTTMNNEPIRAGYSTKAYPIDCHAVLSMTTMTAPHAGGCKLPVIIINAMLQDMARHRVHQDAPKNFINVTAMKAAEQVATMVFQYLQDRGS